MDFEATRDSTPHSTLLMRDDDFRVVASQILDRTMPAPVAVSCAVVVWLSNFAIGVIVASVLFIVSNISLNVWIERRVRREHSVPTWTNVLRIVFSFALMPTITWFAGTQGYGWLAALPSVLALPFFYRSQREWPLGFLLAVAICSTYTIAGASPEQITLSASVLLVAALVSAWTTAALRTNVARAKELAEHLRTQNVVLRRTETQLLDQKTELERSNHELQQFASVASHDLRAPLRAISHLCAATREDLADGDDSELEENLALIQARSLRLSELIAGLLDFARVKDAVENEVQQCCDVRQIIHDVCNELHVPDGYRVHIATTGKWSLRAPPVLLGQVFRNLLGNAIKYRGQGGSNAWIECLINNESVQVYAVHDDGPGIAKAYHEQAFNAFTKLHNNPKIESSGLGLAIVKRIMDYAGGQVDICEGPAGGACFRIAWPNTDNVRVAWDTLDNLSPISMGEYEVIEQNAYHRLRATG